MSQKPPFRIKVCGMREPDNIRAIAALQPDAMGFIFYPKSKRYMAETLDPSVVRELPRAIQTVGVFVNASVDEMILQCERYHLSTVQLHGDEAPEQAEQMRTKSPELSIWKAFGLSNDFDFDSLALYEPHCDAFLFDTKTKGYGGSGQTFDWSLLSSYRGNVPFWLSGGLGPEQVSALVTFAQHNPSLVGVDLNSQLEVAPGLKSVERTQQVLGDLRGEEVYELSSR